MLHTPFYNKSEGHIPDFEFCVEGAFSLIKLLVRPDKDMWPYEDARRAISKVMNGRRAHEVERDLGTYSSRPKPINALVIGAAYCLEAESLYGAVRPDAAWACLLRAYLFIGMASGPKTASEVASKSRTGDKGRNGKHKEIHELVRRLLVERRPEGGWPTRAEAIKAIVGDVSKLHTKLFPLTPDGQKKTHDQTDQQIEQLTKWADKGGLLRAEFEVAAPSLLRRRPRR